jgi:roadblock/LC7 domain-containing protein
LKLTAPPNSLLFTLASFLRKDQWFVGHYLDGKLVQFHGPMTEAEAREKCTAQLMCARRILATMRQVPVEDIEIIGVTP